MDLATLIRDTRVRDNELAIFWVGQAGFILKDSEDRQLAIDLYLTDCGERKRGFKRISPKLLAPTEVAPNYYLITHSHFDHLDYDAIPLIASSQKTVFCGPESCIDQLREDEIREEQCILMKPGDIVLFEGVKVTAVKADHGVMAPDAIGYVVEMGGHCVFFAGDTCYRKDNNEVVSQYKPEVAVVCINGEFGNMDAREGAQAAIDAGAKIAIPCHFWTFVEHRGDPKAFAEYLEEHGQDCKAQFMQQGEVLII